MIEERLISHDIIPLRTSDSGSQALSLMDEWKVSHLPIVNNENFLGLISEEDILNSNTPDEALGNHDLSLSKPFVLNTQHIYDVLKLVYDENLSLVPVLDEKENFLGVILSTDLVRYFAELTSIQHPGGVIVLELNDNDYSLSQIAQIVESNGAKILSLHLNNPDDSTKLEVILKLNRVDIAPILQTFYRYDYIVKDSFDEGDNMDDMRDRYESFLNYLNI